MAKSKKKSTSKVNSSSAAVAQTANPTRNGVLGKRTAEDIILKKMEDIVEKKLGDYRHPKKKQKTVNGGAPSSKKLPQTPPTSQATGSKTLYIGNLRYSVEESDILNFFKDAGDVVAVRLGMKDDRFAGFGHVEFATPDAAQKALKINGECLLDRPVRLDYATERVANTPSKSNGNKRFSQNSGQSQGLTVLVKGFGTIDGVDDPFDSIRSSLEEHFGQCGEITRMYIPKDYESDCPEGVAYIDFSDGEAFSKALELGGSEVSGGTITVKEAT